MSDPTFTTIGDEALEARIVSWVLGEASAFEAAELERLCAERLELRQFRNRIAELNGLLTEAENPVKDEQWKLPAGKRKTIEDLIRPENWETARREQRGRHGAQKTILAIAACLVLSAAVAGLLFPSLKSQKKAGRGDIFAYYDVDGSETEKMVALQPDFPAELIEGTPRPIVLPESTPGKDAFSNMEKELKTRTKRNPSAPSSSMVDARAASSLNGTTVLVPELAKKEASKDFGDGDAFGTGWGGGSGGGGGFEEAPNRKVAERESLALLDEAAAASSVPASRTVAPRTTAPSAGLERNRPSDDAVSVDSLALGDTTAKYGWHRGGGEGEALSSSGLNHGAAAKPGELADNAELGLEVGSGGRGSNENGRNEAARRLAQTGKANEESKPLDQPVRTHPARNDMQADAIDGVRKNLHLSDGNNQLGNYAAAKEGYEDVLRTDPYNKAARRGLEKVDSATSDYYRAAYDHTRAELLAQVNKTWEMAVPVEEPSIEGEEAAGPVDGRKGKVSGQKQLVELEGELAKLRAALEEPSVNDSKKRKLYEDWKALREKAISTKSKVEEIEPSPEPKPVPPAFEEEISAAEDPFSTFSLNISDASFRIAQAALAKGEQPDPAGIKVEQFYNAFDYGDPAPATGQPVACAIEQAAHPVIPGRNLVRIALKTAAAGRSAGQPLRLTLLVDQSGSMTRGDRREAMDQALEGLAGLLSPQDQVNVVGFSRTSRLIAEGLSGDKAATQLADVVNPSASEGGTNLEVAIDLATEMAMRHRLEGAQNRIVLFTDGAANLGDADPERLAEKIEQLRQRGLALDIAGIAAEDINDRLLAELARKGNGRYHIVGKGDGGEFAKRLAGAFRPAAENVKVQVRFNPERVKGYKLLGFEKDRLKTEDFRNDAVDAAEMAAEEAGVAIYQVEPIPGGSGEIGEVSVRFRETASGEMVERSWTMSHDSSTPVLERATPSMQLATLALLTGEKLKGGPMGAAVDFNTYAAVQAAVKQAFGHDTRIGELLRMIDALK